jgi:hypothetical protein
MHDNKTFFLLNEKGQRLPLDKENRALPAPTGLTSDFVNEAVNQLGYVLFTLAHRAAVIELSPHSVQPRAARQASRIVTSTAAECVLLVHAGEAWRRSKYQFFASTRVAGAVLLWLARSAERRAAFEKRVRATAALDEIEDDLWLPVPGHAVQTSDVNGVVDAYRRLRSAKLSGAGFAGCRRPSGRDRAHAARAGSCGHV